MSIIFEQKLAIKELEIEHRYKQLLNKIQVRCENAVIKANAERDRVIQEQKIILAQKKLVIMERDLCLKKINDLKQQNEKWNIL